MRLFLAGLFAAMVLAGAFLSTHTADAYAPRQLTTTNVCVVYAMDGVYSGGIAIVAPETVTYKHLKSGGAFVTLPGQDRLKVDYLSVTPLPPGETECAGIV